MNAFDYFFENTYGLDKNFLVGKEEISFKELYAKSLALSDYIYNKFGEHKNIMLLSPNNSFFLIVYLAILKSGNTVVPLDPMIEEDNFFYIRNLTEASILFVAPPVRNRLKLTEEECYTEEDLPLNGMSAKLSEGVGDGDRATEHFSPECIAEIIFTSGSTGKPKGVMLSHKNLVANTGSIIDYLELTEKDRMLCVLPFYYCYGLSLFHTHLRVGASMVFNNAFIFLGAVINDLKEQRCTGFAGVPSHFQILLRKSDSFKTTEFPDLKYVTQAGGKLAPVFIDEFREAHPKVDFIVMYGQTEATARLSYLPAAEYEKRKASIGKAIPGVELCVLDEEGNPVIPKQIGEVVARGDNIMSGYYKDMEGSWQALRSGWLYTGDLGTIDEDGYIYLTARKKEIIKVGGKRISPKEIEAVILSLPEVVDCSIEGVEDEILGEALKASVVLNTPGSINEEQIKEHCSKHLALFKVPHFFEIKDRLEMSATGKKVKKVEK